ncbi:hypothetical protein EHV15_34695 [Paenibacillus oralis]|uniref:Uncharacterized protein n=1 Tax=Paenibacillus oralis TaxID=2490856 RepID=A0A3P3T9M0_9BACL|nr:hypothetical protein [Paenibacillus oralis]RRJ54745.1 hypothetical protein EHV15_34695 [Paenibacillus oralis]
MDLNCITYELFPSINFSLMQEIIAFSEQKNVAVLKFSKMYNLEYIGELAERWQDRGIIKDNRDLLALILAIMQSSSGTFLYDQKKLFIKSVCEYLKNHWHAPSAAAILNYGRRDLESVPELSHILDVLVTSSETFDSESERVLLISLLSDFHAAQATNHELRNYILKQIDEMQLSLTNIHVEYPLLLLLSGVYRDLNKPTSKEFKTKGMSRLLQVISSLRTKEITRDNNYPASQVLGVKRNDITVINFYLAYENTPRNHSITNPGFERIKDNFLDVHFTSELDVPEQVIRILDNMILEFEKDKSEGHPLRFLLRRLTHQETKIFPNRNNLKLLVEKAKDILFLHLNESYVSLLQEEVVEGKLRLEIIERLLESYKMTKEQFDYLEHLREMLGINFEVTKTYTEMCLEHGYIFLDQIDDLEERGMTRFIIEILKEKESFAELLDFLERVKAIYHRFLAEEVVFNRLKSKMSDDLKKRLYVIYLNALYTYNASKYPERVFDMLKNVEFINLFELSDADIDGIERKLYNSKLLSEYQLKMIREKYMTPEELEELRIKELCKELKSCSRYSLSTFAGKHWSKMMENESLRTAFIESLISLETKDNFDVGRMLFVFYKLRSKNVFNPDEIARIEVAALEKTQKIKIA